MLAIASVSSLAGAQAPPPMDPAVTGPPPGLAPLAPLERLPEPRYTGDTVINSGALLGVGVVLASLGFIGTIAGISVAGNSERTDPCYADPCADNDLGKRAAGLVVGFASLGMLGAGIPMIAVGARQVPERVAVYVAPGALRLLW